MSDTDQNKARTTHFGYEQVPVEEKVKRVGQGTTLIIDAAYVEKQLRELVTDEDLSRFIL